MNIILFLHANNCSCSDLQMIFSTSQCAELPDTMSYARHNDRLDSRRTATPIRPRYCFSKHGRGERIDNVLHVDSIKS